MKIWNRHAVPEGIDPTYIGRGTVWGNPYKVGEGYDQEGAAMAYRRRLARLLAARHKETMKMVLDLCDVEHIACSCKPKDCHGDCFVEIYDIVKEKQLSIPKAIREWVKLHGFPGPDTDGVDHINMYSKAKTKLGKKLTNMSNLPVFIDGVGQFLSLEGYWYWLSTGQQYSELLDMNGFEAKTFGRDKERTPSAGFQDKIRVALWKRFQQNPTLTEVFKNSTLPFKHYYHYGDDDVTVAYPPFDWVTKEIEFLRKLYKGELNVCIIAGSRGITDPKVVEEAIAESGFDIDVVVCGLAKGADTLGAQWATANGKLVRNFEADWELLGKKAGFLRNNDMGDFCTCGIVIIKDNSPGSTQMAKYLESKGKKSFVKHV